MSTKHSPANTAKKITVKIVEKEEELLNHKVDLYMVRFPESHYGTKLIAQGFTEDSYYVILERKDG